MNTLLNKRRRRLGAAIGLALTALTLSACHQSETHKPITGLYYGYCTNNNPNQFNILTFPSTSKTKVGLRQTLGHGMMTNRVLNITYGKDTVTVQGMKKPMVLTISKDGHTLTCKACDGKVLPKVYTIGVNKGQVFGADVANSAFKTMLKDSKINDGIQI